jgi:hypothetical protein
VKRIGLLLAALFALAISAIVVESIVQAVYPGSLKWTAPMFCPEDQPDAFVVRTETQDAEGTAISFSLYCMGERGDFTEVGTWRPYGILFLYIYGALVGLALLLVIRIVRRRAKRRAEPVL